ncbi:hypothetical protein O3P69_005868 [Scylla paramamosain]|uniref:Uncharacterized protein n=1 Tax=Scylla paramamosain TaxID=85552 RepID=A0AAW0U8K2_SCYPA
MSLEGSLHALPELSGAKVTARVSVATLGCKDDAQDTQELIEARPGIRYSRPDVTDTRTTCLRLLEDTRDLEEADFSFGFFSGSPDLARPADDFLIADKLSTSRSLSPAEGVVEQESTPIRREEPLCLVASGSRRLSMSLEDLPTDIQEHILRCQCSCDHLGYGNFSSAGREDKNSACLGQEGGDEEDEWEEDRKEKEKDQKESEDDDKQDQVRTHKVNIAYTAASDGAILDFEAVGETMPVTSVGSGRGLERGCASCWCSERRQAWVLECRLLFALTPVPPTTSASPLPGRC